MPPHPTSWRPTSILSPHLGLVLLSSSSCPTKTLHAPLLFPIPIRATFPGQPINP
jgi:hypothetical protein